MYCSSEAVLHQDLTLMRDAIDQYYADKGQYPGQAWTHWSPTGYLRKIPEDPFTKSMSSWQTVPSEPDPNNPTAQAGVFDVKSEIGSNGARWLESTRSGKPRDHGHGQLEIGTSMFSLITARRKIARLVWFSAAVASLTVACERVPLHGADRLDDHADHRRHGVARQWLY